MEFWSVMKGIALWPIVALIDVPFVRLGAHLLKLRRPTFRAAYLLILTAGGASILASLVVWLILPKMNAIADAAIFITLALLVYSWAFGYYITDRDGVAIGYWKGAQVFLIATVLFGSLLLAVASLIMGVSTVWSP